MTDHRRRGRVRGSALALSGALLTATSFVAAGGVSNAALADSWAAADNLSTAGQDAYSPEIAISADGTRATAVWERSNGTNNIAQTASATISGNTATWSAPTNLSAAGENASAARIAISSDGTRATAIWSRWVGGALIVQTASATISGNTATWSAPANLSAAGHNASSAEIALSSDGTKATAVWYRSNGTNLVIQGASATISGNTATWSAATSLSAAGQNAHSSRVAISADGTKATSVWTRSNGTNLIIQGASATISGNTATWSAAANLSAAGEHAGFPQIAISSGGTRATAVWSRSNGANNIVQGASATISGNTATWSAATNLSATGQDAANPEITTSSDGTKATAVWSRSNGTNSIVQTASATTSGNSATWSAATNLSAAGQDATYPQIAMSADGTRATSVWYRSDGANTIVQAASGLFEAPIPTPTPTPTPTPGPQPPASEAQAPANGCVKARGGRIPRRGARPLTKRGCKTNAGQWVGVAARVTGRTWESRAGSRLTLVCVGVGKKARRARETGYGDGSRYCPRGSVALKAAGRKARISITWSAPATGQYAAYGATRTYRTK